MQPQGNELRRSQACRVLPCQLISGFQDFCHGAAPNGVGGGVFHAETVDADVFECV